jgi:hypothetical protein
LFITRLPPRARADPAISVMPKVIMVSLPVPPVIGRVLPEGLLM